MANSVVASLSYCAEENIVCATMRGKAQSIDVLNNANAIIEFANSYNAKAVLIDVREFEHAYAKDEFIDVCNKLAPLLGQLIIARVVSYQGFMHELVTQKVRELGVRVRNFDCQEQARNWLRPLSC
ncbi:hypothetical protein MHM95_05555 [Pseudoalteromonas sp. CnMc7-15]|uniref:hypothetical protein n=1 Tax=unclassified Pseudoalteromonas TaxID=194690 RepID=UPI001EF731D1|nr:hypothetical protein [Pseudoalteromonas sp. CnMc7-15]MCG7565750.1 hypothetical protein [Pseudoalteromonas sp. CnMc7-15]